jgi:hypothetical protein
MILLPMVSVHRKLQEARPFQHADSELFEFINVRKTSLCLCLYMVTWREGIDVILKNFTLTA